jgi:alpha-tubulin suppressor-like RCC1 family protein
MNSSSSVRSLIAAVSIAAIMSITAPLPGASRVLSAGHNVFGQLGDRTRANRAVPTHVAIGNSAGALSGGGVHSLVEINDAAFGWGCNAFQQVLPGTIAAYPIPQLITGLPQLVATASGQFHSLALFSDGTVQAWGANQIGQAGIGTTSSPVSTPTPVSLTDVVAIAAGLQHSLALRSDGSVYAWGFNDTGQLGL